MIVYLLCCLLISSMVRPSLSISDEVLPIPEQEIPPAYWEALARKNFEASEKIMSDMAENAMKAKNVILFLGDGMGLPTISAGRFFADNGSTGQPRKLSFEEWDFNTVARTYDLETMVTDSASSATAYLTGTKTRTGMLGVTGAIKVRECVAYTDAQKTISIVKAAAKAGKATGILTTARITHASPGGAFGHSAFRDWECDADITKDKKKTCPGGACDCTDLAKQLALDNLDVNVILGGGQQKFYPKEMQLPINTSHHGQRDDGINLAAEWLKLQQQKGRKVAYVSNLQEYKALDTSKIDYLMGLLAPSHLPYVLHRQPDEPSLPELTAKAIEVLQHNPNGFFLFVEGGRIDHGHHDNTARHALTELLEMKDAVDVAVKMTKKEETLIIVTADHSHSFELVGQPARFESLLLKDKGYGPKVKDGKNMLPLNYINGPGAKINATRDNVSAIPNEVLLAPNFLQQALVPLNWSTHGGDDVGVYATGPFSWMFHRTIDNTFIAQTMKYAMCVEPYIAEKHCSRMPGAASVHKPFLGTILVVLLFLFRP